MDTVELEGAGAGVAFSTEGAAQARDIGTVDGARNAFDNAGAVHGGITAAAHRLAAGRRNGDMRSAPHSAGVVRGNLALARGFGGAMANGASR